jgi:hypothetical protein
MLRMISSLQLATFRFCLLLNFFLTKEVCVLSSLSMLITTQRIKESSSGAFSFLTVQAFSPKLTSTSVSAAIWPGSVAAIRIARNFTSTAPNRVWTSDITYLWTDKGWLYLAFVLDLFNREVVGWSLNPRMTADIVTDDHRLVQEAPNAGAAASLRPRQPVRLPRLSGQAQGIRMTC